MSSSSLTPRASAMIIQVAIDPRLAPDTYLEIAASVYPVRKDNSF
jgi:hypothetical protein